MTMTISDLHQFFSPYARARYQAESAGNAQETLFVSLEGLRLWAASQALTLRAAMIYLLGRNIWPERFRRNFGLVRSGVGSIRLVDNDVFDESNLNRQRFCSERMLGQRKVCVVRNALADIASHVETEALGLVADEGNLPDLVAGMDVALDCLDNISAKTALERAALAAGVPFVHGSVLREEGFCYANSGPQARLEELYPQGQSNSELELARGEGVGALAPASVACLMAKLALRAILSRTASSALFHLDLSVPEMERFDWAGKA